MIGKLLIANRGEIAVRIMRTCKDMDITAVAVFSDADRDSAHAEAADESIHLPGVASTETYLDMDRIIEAAINSGAEAVHPGYGFLSENAEFAGRVAAAGLIWVGPPVEAIEALGDKISARKLATSAGVPVVPGTLAPAGNSDVVRIFADQHGWPVAVKASGGGGGRGLKVARSLDDARDAFDAARREAKAYFDSEDVYLEKYLETPKHLEVQLLASTPDDALWLGVRDCSLQRRHQKLIEETPPPMWADREAEMGEAAVALSKAAGYVGAGTVEMLVDANGDFFFLEVNSRLQVEHTVTEEVSGLDLVRCQLLIAADEPLGFGQADVDLKGHSIECRINAEDPARGFVPTPGVLTRYQEPSGTGVRVDAGYRSGDEIPSAYDSLVAKVISWGEDREEARTRMIDALNAFGIEGIKTTIPAHLVLLDNPDFVLGEHTTGTVEAGALDVLIEPEPGPPQVDENVLLVAGEPVRLWNPAMAPSAAAAVHGGIAHGECVAPMQGTILKILAPQGTSVAAGEAVMVLEAMKMETTITATKSGTVAQILVEQGRTVPAGEILAIIE